jgi:hypothetical protein
MKVTKSLAAKDRPKPEAQALLEHLFKATDLATATTTTTTATTTTTTTDVERTQPERTQRTSKQSPAAAAAEVFQSMCLLVGVQLGVGKVFFRRGAFERLEALRTARVRSATVRIQTAHRTCVDRSGYLRVRTAALTLQCWSRGYVRLP